MVKIDEMVTLHVKDVEKDSIVFSKKVREWCNLPYPEHPDGCPNYNKKDGCPPRSKFRKDILDKYDTFTLVYAKFDIQGYISKMKELHPLWSEKQLRNVLYWQGSLKKILKDHITKRMYYDDILGAGSGFLNAQSMESAGIDVFATLKRNNIPFNRKARDFILMVSLTMRSTTNRSVESRSHHVQMDTL